MSEQMLVILSIIVLLGTIILTKIDVIPKKYFQFIFNLIFFSYVYLCFRYNYMDIMNRGMIVYGGSVLFCWFMEWKKK